MKIAKSKSVIITSADNRYWFRLYHRRQKILALCNFIPSAYPSLIDEMERLVNMDSITNYHEANMGVLVFTVSKGVPLVSIQNALTKVSVTEPVETNHHATSQELKI